MPEERGTELGMTRGREPLWPSGGRWRRGPDSSSAVRAQRRLAAEVVAAAVAAAVAVMAVAVTAMAKVVVVVERLGVVMGVWV